LSIEKRAHNFDDKTGRRYGKLTVLGLHKIETLSSGKKRSLWLCKCDCGNEARIRTANLTCNITKSCGCLALENMNKFIQEKRKKPIGIRCRNAVFNSYKTSSKARGLDFKLSMEDFVRLTSMNCHYCDSVPKSVKKSEYGHGEFVYNGIDRVDNSVGYTIDNCVSCCGMCNFMKRSYNQLDFINQAIKISNKWSKNENK
jgi:hypothetical protein